MIRPRFKACYRPAVVEDEGVLLLSEDAYVVLEGPLTARLAPFLDGRHTVEDILQRFEGVVPLEEVCYVLMRMEADGYVVDAREAGPPSAFWEALGVPTRQAETRLPATAVALHALGDLNEDALRAALGRTGIPVSQSGGFTVVLASDYLHPELGRLNQQALRTGRPWMLVKPVGRTVWLGPLFVPGRTGCWACLAQRLRLHREAEQLTGMAAPTLSLPSTEGTALHLAATEIARWVGEGKNPRMEGRLVSFDLATLDVQSHVLTRRPQCPVCNAGLPRAALVPPVLQARPKTGSHDGGYRTVPAAETLRAYQHHISPLTGILPSLKPAPLPGNVPFVHIYLAGPAQGGRYDSLEALRRRRYSQAMGKGTTRAQARASGLCEALERYAGTFQGDELRCEATYRELGAAAVHPNACMNYSADQYRRRTSVAESACRQAPAPFDEAAPVEWSPVWSLTHGAWRYLPTAYCYYDYPAIEPVYCRADSNGNAAGNTLEEAILQGFLELVERDSVALWWYNRLPRPGVDLDSFDEPYIRSLISSYKDLHRALWVLDLTSDFGIASFAAVSRKVDGGPEHLLMGFGSHLDARIAVLRALAEVNQMLPTTLQTGGRHPADAGETARAWEDATVQHHPYLTPSPDLPLRTAADYPRPCGGDLLEDIETCVAAASQRGLEVLVLDQTRPDVGLSVVKVVAPGMRHFWPRFGPGRLYDVPVAMGWLQQPLQEHELNPMPILV